MRDDKEKRNKNEINKLVGIFFLISVSDIYLTYGSK